MDRRKKRTSTAQYMMYIDMMEKDPIFATGRVPRDVDMNYLHERWKELSDKLNTCNSGPKLTAGEWRKRLNDWKNTTRCKYRRSLSSGDVSLTTLENKALHLFGKAPNVNNPTEELSIHLKSEKEEEIDEDDMDHQRTSEIFQKELQAAVEEAIGGDDDEEVMDEQEDQEGELLDPLPVETKNIAINNSSGGGGVGSGGGGAVGTAQTVDNSTTTTYRTIVVENAPYNEADEEEDIEYITAHRCRASTSSSANSNAVAHKATTTSNVTAGGNVTKLINGDIPLKRLRTHAPEHIIYEVSSVKKVPSITQTHPPPQQQQQQQQHHHHQPQLQQQQQQQQSTPRILKTLHNTEAQQHYTEPHHSSTSTVSNAAVPSVLGSSADGRDIARQLKRIADIKAEKLKFEVARFKFNNPGFVFNLHPI